MRYLLNQLATFVLAPLGAVVLVAGVAHAGGNAANGKKLYESMCSSCHGLTGLGDGPVAAALPPAMKPKNLNEGGWKYATDDAKLKELLKKGGAAVGLSPLMSGAPSASDSDLNDLVAYVNTMRKK
jgi:mono/diheme cytochrome c family protein